MTIEDIVSHIRRHTYGLLSDGEVVYAAEMALTAHGGIDPADVDEVNVVFGHGSLDIELVVHEPKQLTLF